MGTREMGTEGLKIDQLTQPCAALLRRTTRAALSTNGHPSFQGNSRPTAGGSLPPDKRTRSDWLINNPSVRFFLLIG
jgi:hypothetical protein